MIDVSVVIVNYNTFRLTSDCIRSIQTMTVGISYEIIVVDNASGEKETASLQENFPDARMLFNRENLGFAKANNQGIQLAQGKYILLLNSDTLLKNNALKLCVEYLDNHPHAGVVSSRVEYPDGRHQSVCQRFPSLKWKLFELFRLQKIFDKKGNKLFGAFFNHNSVAQPDWVWGTFFFLRKEVLSHLQDGKLDERYFMYGEDMQWCYDIRKAGYEVHYYPEAVIIHLMGASGGAKNEMMGANLGDFIQRNVPSWKRNFMRILDSLLRT